MTYTHPSRNFKSCVVWLNWEQVVSKKVGKESIKLSQEDHFTFQVITAPPHPQPGTFFLEVQVLCSVVVWNCFILSNEWPLFLEGLFSHSWFGMFILQTNGFFWILTQSLGENVLKWCLVFLPCTKVGKNILTAGTNSQFEYKMSLFRKIAFFFFFPLRPNPQDMEVPRPGIGSEPHLWPAQLRQCQIGQLYMPHGMEDETLRHGRTWDGGGGEWEMPKLFCFRKK